jgi:hypothetical protein
MSLTGGSEGDVGGGGGASDGLGAVANGTVGRAAEVEPSSANRRRDKGRYDAPGSNGDDRTTGVSAA